MNQKFLLIVSCCLLAASCQQKHPTLTILVNPQLKAAFSFNEGSYWIYQDSLNGQIDSFWINYRLFDGNGCAQSYSEYCELIEYYISDSNLSPLPTSRFFNMWEIYLFDSSISLSYIKNFGTGGYSTNYGPLIIFPYSKWKPGGWYDVGPGLLDTNAIENVIGNYSVNGIIYQNVGVVRHHPDSSAQGTMDNWFYFAPNVGMIQMKINQTAFYNEQRNLKLLRYKIIK